MVMWVWLTSLLTVSSLWILLSMVLSTFSFWVSLVVQDVSIFVYLCYSLCTTVFTADDEALDAHLYCFFLIKKVETLL